MASSVDLNAGRKADFDLIPGSSSGSSSSSSSNRRSTSSSSSSSAGGVALLERKAAKAAVQDAEDADSQLGKRSGRTTATSSMTSLEEAAEVEAGAAANLPQYKTFVPGGRAALVSIAAMAFGVIIVKLAFEFTV